MNSIVYKNVQEISPLLVNKEPARKRTTSIYITFDLDWCHDDILCDTLDIINEYDVKATFFATKGAPSVSLIEQNSNYELGIHPNFNPLLTESAACITAESIIDDLLSTNPNAKSVRSHSLVQGSTLSNLFRSRGLTHESNLKVPFSSCNRIHPFMNASGMIICPFQWGDYSDHLQSFQSLLPLPEYVMVNFHPIHVFLNTESVQRYEYTRHLHHSPEKLIKHRFDGIGTRDRLLELLQLGSSQGDGPS